MDIDTDSLEAAALLAVPGPWHVTGTGSVRDIDEQMVATTTAYERRELDAEFIAAASPSVVLKLIQRLRDTEHERDEMIRQHADTVKNRDENFRSMMRMVAMAEHWYHLASDAMTAGLAECERLRNALRRMVQHATQSHPLPWHVEEDWTQEVTAADGFIIVKCMTMAEAANIIREAEEYEAEMKAVIPDVEAWLREQEDQDR